MTPRQRPRRSLEDILGPPAPRVNKGGRPPEAHRAAKVKADTELVRLKVAKLRGELVPAADVEAEWVRLATDLRQRLLSIPSRVQGRQPHSREIEAAYDTEIRAALEALARGGDSDVSP